MWLVNTHMGHKMILKHTFNKVNSRKKAVFLYFSLKAVWNLWISSQRPSISSELHKHTHKSVLNSNTVLFITRNMKLDVFLTQNSKKEESFAKDKRQHTQSRASKTFLAAKTSVIITYPPWKIPREAAIRSRWLNLHLPKSQRRQKAWLELVLSPVASVFYL